MDKKTEEFLNDENVADDSLEESNELDSFADQKPKKSKKPLLVVIIILLLVGASLGAAYKWYGQIQEYKQNQEALNVKNDKLEKELKALKGDPANTGDVSNSINKTYTLQTYKLSFNYPQNWTINDVKVDNSSKEEPYESLTITSPDKKLSVYLLGTYGGVGGGCDDVDRSSDTVLSLSPLQNYKIDPAANYVERIIKNKQDGKYYVAYGISNSGYLAVGESKICINTSYLITPIPGGGGLSFGNGYAALVNPIKFDTESEARAFFKTRNYLIAKAIVQSVKTN